MKSELFCYSYLEINCVLKVPYILCSVYSNHMVTVCNERFVAIRKLKNHKLGVQMRSGVCSRTQGENLLCFLKIKTLLRTVIVYQYNFGFDFILNLTYRDFIKVLNLLVLCLCLHHFCLEPSIFGIF